jgi:hypothetical protein
MWLAAVGLSQVGLVAAAIWLFILPTQRGIWPPGLFSHDMPLRGFGPIVSRGRDVYYYGHPIPWSECHQETAWSSEIVGSVLKSREVWRGPEVIDGWNLALPPVLVLAAVSLPPVASILASRLVRRIRRRTDPVLFSRPARLWCVVWFASAATVSVAWLEAKTAGFIIIPSWSLPQPDWSGHQPSPWVVKSHAAYHKSIGHAVQGRRWLDQQLPGGLLSSDWPSRTRLTVAAFLSGTAVGCFMFRPLRGASVEGRLA